LAGEPLLAHWTQTFMGSAARFIMQFFPIFLLGAGRPDPRSVAYRLTGHPQARQS
jgi:hypothetical protein